MRKSIFLIGVLFVISIFVNCVYGYTTSDYGNIKFDSISEMYDYLENKGITFDKTINYDYYNTYRDELINSDLFKQYIEDYPYYIFSGTSIYMFNKIPTFHFEYNDNGDGTFYIETNIVSDGKFNTAQVYFTTGDKITSAVRDNLSHYRTISPSIKFSTKFYNRENLSFLIKAENFDFLYTGTNENIIVKNPEFSFIPTYSENYQSCNLKLDIINEPENYTLQYAINSSSSEWREFDNSVGVTVENNCLVIVRMLDENGDEIFANSYNINLLSDNFSKYKFKVDFDTPTPDNLNFTPILYNDPYECFDIIFSLNSVSLNNIYNGEIKFSETGEIFSYKKYLNINDFKLKNGSTYYLKSDGAIEFVLNFKIINKNTGVIVLTRSFKFKWSDVNKAPSPISSFTNGEQDAFFDSGSNNSFSNNILNSDSLEIDWSVDNSKETVKSFFNNGLDFFNVIVAFLSVLPPWLTVPLYTFFILLIVLFVIKFIRG